jgi:hypothetical protein
MDDLRIIWHGEPGERWRNDTGFVAWQFVARLVNTCGLCLSYHLAISPTPWAIPYHPNCACMQTEVYPGELADPFVDFGELLGSLPRHEQTEAVGQSVWLLLTAGLARWEDVVARDGVRTLAEIVKRLRLSVAAMVKAGIGRGIAERAVAMARATAEALAAQRRQELAEHARRAAVPADALRQSLILSDQGGKDAKIASLPLDQERAQFMADYLRLWPGTPPSWMWGLVPYIGEVDDRKRKVAP